MQEVRYDNIRVSYVMPGSVATGFSGGDETKGADWKIAPDEVADVVVNLLRHSAAACRAASSSGRRSPENRCPSRRAPHLRRDRLKNLSRAAA